VLDNRRVQHHQRSEAAATYLENHQWQAPVAPHTDFPQRVLATPLLPYDTDVPDAEEIAAAIKGLKWGKAGGPDDISPEHLKTLTEDNQQPLVKLVQQWWTQETIPRQLSTARVVHMIKKREHTRLRQLPPHITPQSGTESSCDGSPKTNRSQL
jgi:hypothetical protein